MSSASSSTKQNIKGNDAMSDEDMDSEQIARLDTEKLARMIAVENLPFNFAEKVSLNDYRITSNPDDDDACYVSRTTVTRTLFKIYRKEKKDLINYLENYRGRVSVCAGIWSDHWNTDSYICVACHYIDDDWNMQKKILAFRIFSELHTENNIYKILKDVFEEYKIDNKIFTIGFDNVFSDTEAIPRLIILCNPYFKYSHSRCELHVLNLCVQKGLELLDNVISPIKKAIHYLWTHPKVMKAWMKFCENKKKRPIRFSRIIPTRWKSIYKLLCKSDEYKELLCDFMICNSTDIILQPEQWNTCTKICQLLKVFNDATDHLSAIYNPTAHLFLFRAISIVTEFEECEKDEQLNPCVQAMKGIWLKYYNKIPMIYLLAMVFDPRIRFDRLSDILSAYYDRLGEDDNYIHAKITEIREIFYSLHSEYLKVYEPKTTVVTPSKRFYKHFLEIMEKEKKKKLEGLGYSSTTFEIGEYLTACLMFADEDCDYDFDVLQWWKKWEKIFPVLSIIAKHILATPVSAVALEQEFYDQKNVLDQRRSCMNPELVEAHFCVEDWTKAGHRQQELNQEEAYLDNNEDSSESIDSN